MLSVTLSRRSDTMFNFITDLFEKFRNPGTSSPSMRAVKAYRDALDANHGELPCKYASFPKADGHFPPLKGATPAPKNKLRLKHRP